MYVRLDRWTAEKHSKLITISNWNVSGLNVTLNKAVGARRGRFITGVNDFRMEKYSAITYKENNVTLSNYSGSGDAGRARMRQLERILAQTFGSSDAPRIDPWHEFMAIKPIHVDSYYIREIEWVATIYQICVDCLLY